MKASTILFSEFNCYKQCLGITLKSMYLNAEHILARVLGIGSHSYGDWESLGPDICRPENQGSLWCNSIWVQRPENQELPSLRAGEAGCPSLTREREFAFLCPPWIGWPTALGSWSSLLSLPIQRLIPSRNTHRHTQKWRFTSCLDIS